MKNDDELFGKHARVIHYVSKNIPTFSIVTLIKINRF